MKVATKYLKGAALDYAVSLAEGFKYGTPSVFETTNGLLFPLSRPDWATLGAALLQKNKETGEWFWSRNVPRYQTHKDGSTILDREHISTMWMGAYWLSVVGSSFAELNAPQLTGTTRMESALRAWVYYKLGEFVEVPDQFKEE